jgi:hypothetical protein
MSLWLPRDPTAALAALGAYRFGSFTVTGPFGIQQHVLELEPGALSLEQLDSQPEMMLVLEGELTRHLDIFSQEMRRQYTSMGLESELERYSHLSWEKQVYRAGESFVIPAGHRFQIGNEGNVKAVFVTTLFKPEITPIAMKE